ncbi:MAG: rod shape-determining protein MreC [Desulfotalea sp.]
MARRARNYQDTKGRWSIIKNLAVGALVLVVGVFVLGSLVGGSFKFPQLKALQGVGFLQESARAPFVGFGAWFDNYVRLGEVDSINDELREKIEDLQGNQLKYKEQLKKYQILLRELSLEDSLEIFENSIVANIVGRSRSRVSGVWTQTVVINRGLDDGVNNDMMVYNHQGVVGQVLHATDNYSKVLIATAPSSAIDVMVQDNRIRGILKGNGKDGYNLEYVAKYSAVKEGDKIITAGFGGVFPSGMYLGDVSSVDPKSEGMFIDITVKPAVDFSSIEYVRVDLTDRTEIRLLLNSKDER